MRLLSNVRNKSEQFVAPVNNTTSLSSCPVILNNPSPIHEINEINDPDVSCYNSIPFQSPYFSTVVTMSCFHESCSRNAKFWCQNCSRRFCSDCINKRHQKDTTEPSAAQPSNAELLTTQQLDPTAVGNHINFQCSHPVNWLAIVGVQEDIVLCHFCNQYEQLDRIVSHCRCKRHLKQVQLQLEQQHGQ